jgi:5-methylcytosine-specific restriction endonuclease McrA
MKRDFTERNKKISQAHKRGSYFNCIICNKEFWRKPFEIKKGNNKFCSKKCYFIWQKGRKRSAEFCKKCKDKRPEQNGNWKGGITPINAKIRNTPEYIKWRSEVFERDKYTCQECGACGCYLEAHHIKPFALYPELRFIVSNGITLCRKCHSKKPKGKEILCMKSKT